MAPTSDAETSFAQRRQMVKEGLAGWSDLLAADLPTANEVLRAAGYAPFKLD